MAQPFSTVDEEHGPTILSNKLDGLKKYLETYYNKINLVAFSPPGAQIEKIPEKPDILLYVEQIESTGYMLMPGGLLQQPYIFMLEYSLCASLRSIYNNITNASK